MAIAPEQNNTDALKKPSAKLESSPPLIKCFLSHSPRLKTPPSMSSQVPTRPPIMSDIARARTWPVFMAICMPIMSETMPAEAKTAFWYFSGIPFLRKKPMSEPRRIAPALMNTANISHLFAFVIDRICRSIA